MANMIFGIYLGYICAWKPKFFVEKTTKSIFPWTRDSQCQNSADCLAKNTPNVPKFMNPICLPKPKSLGLHQVSVVRDIDYIKLSIKYGIICQNLSKSVKLFPPAPTRFRRPWSLCGVIKLFWQFVLHFITLAPANFMNIKFFLLSLF